MSSPSSGPAAPIVMIPARLQSSRLPNKPLADIGGRPMILHVLDRAVATGIGRVVVAAADPAIVAVVEAAGGEAVATDPDHPSGSDRIAEALTRIDPAGRHDAVVNLQGDLPTIEAAAVHAALDLLDEPEVDIGTLVAEIVDPEERTDPAVTKAVVEMAPGARRGRALYFSRQAVPANDGPLWHHIGLYVYRRAALMRFVGLPPAVLEQREKLEQLRALVHGMRIDAARVDTVPLGVDTPEDLHKARAMLARHRAG